MRHATRLWLMNASGAPTAAAHWDRRGERLVAAAPLSASASAFCFLCTCSQAPEATSPLDTTVGVKTHHTKQFPLPTHPPTKPWGCACVCVCVHVHSLRMSNSLCFKKAGINTSKLTHLHTQKWKKTQARCARETIESERVSA